MLHISYPKLLLVFMLHQVCCQKIEPAFRPKGSRFSLGNCFGLESIVVYRCSPEGDQLLGNSSDDSVSPPADLQGRVHVNKNHNVVGLRIYQLTFMDSGIYRRECWKEGKQLHNNTLQLQVCGEESSPVEIVETEHGVELECNVTGLGLDGSFVRWYQEVSDTFELQLFLDSSMSLLPLIDKLKGVVKVQNNGTSLSFDSSLLKNSSQFYCVVNREHQCLRYQNMYQTFDGEIHELFASRGESVVLPCQLNGNKLHWRTPVGLLNSTNMRTEKMSISGDFSLVISSVVDKHGGDYSCITSSQDIQFSVVLCPSKHEKLHDFSRGTVVQMECDVNPNDSHQVRWYQEKPGGIFELIHDSGDKTAAVPEHLRGRMVPSATSLSLEISDVRPEDEGVYFCVVHGDQDYLEDDYEYIEEGGDESEESYDDMQYWQENSNCILKQKTILRERIENPGDITPVAVGAAVGVLVLVVVVVAAFIIKKRRRTNQDIL